MHMHVLVNTSSLPVYKKYRIASLLCIFETSLSISIETNFRVAKPSVSTYLSRWMDSRPEISSIRKQVLILVHFYIIETQVFKTVTMLHQERYAKFAKKNLGKA